MKYLSVILATAIINSWSLFTAVNAEKETAGDIISLKTTAAIECSKEHNISKEAIKDIMTNVRVPEDQEVKCWLHCVMKTIGLIKDEHFDWEFCKTISKIGLTDEDKAKVDEIAEICKAEVTDDEKDQCQLAYNKVVCKINNWNKLGLPKGTWEE